MYKGRENTCIIHNLSYYPHLSFTLEIPRKIDCCQVLQLWEIPAGSIRIELATLRNDKERDHWHQLICETSHASQEAVKLSINFEDSVILPSEEHGDKVCLRL